MTLDNLLRIGKLKPHAADKLEIDRLLAAAGRALADARATVEEIRAWLAAHHPHLMGG